jgi:hypothetical protein
VIVPGRRSGEYPAVMCGRISRYGASGRTVAHALLRLLSSCAAVAADDPGRCAATGEQARIVVSDAGRGVAPARRPCPDARRGRVPAADSSQTPAPVTPTRRRAGRATHPAPPGDTANTGTQPAVMAGPATRQRTSGSGQYYGRFQAEASAGREAAPAASTHSICPALPCPALPCRGGGERQPAAGGGEVGGRV